MKQPDLSARREYDEIVNDTPTLVAIKGTKRTVKICGIKPYTLECLTRLWLKRDIRVAGDSADTLKDLCTEPYFTVKEACLFVLNGYWRIKLLYPFMWRIWGKWRGYTEEQMSPIIQMGKKKLPLMAYWTNMAYSVDMRTDWMKLTAKEAKQYQAELLSAANAPSLKNTRNTEERNGVSDRGDTDAS